MAIWRISGAKFMRLMYWLQISKWYVVLLLFSLLLNGCHVSTGKEDQVELLNVSYDVMRDFYKAYNPLFIRHFQLENNHAQLIIKQSNGGSSKQALAVANGLQADVVSMNQISDIDLLVQKKLVQPSWSQQLPNNSVPFSSVVVFLVRKNNPKQIHDWADLIRSDVQIVSSNPKTSGNGRYALLAAYGYALQNSNGDKFAARKYVEKLFHQVVILASGSRAASNTFVQRQIGDVLLVFENEASMVAKDLWPNQFEVIYPSYSIQADSPVAVIETTTSRKQTTVIAQSYLRYLWSDEGQNLAAQFYLRPSNLQVAKRYAERFPEIRTFRAEEVLGNWTVIMQEFFADGGIFDQIYRQ